MDRFTRAQELFLIQLGIESLRNRVEYIIQEEEKEVEEVAELAEEKPKKKRTLAQRKAMSRRMKRVWKKKKNAKPNGSY